MWQVQPYSRPSSDRRISIRPKHPRRLHRSPSSVPWGASIMRPRIGMPGTVTSRGHVPGFPGQGGMFGMSLNASCSL